LQEDDGFGDEEGSSEEEGGDEADAMGLERSATVVRTRRPSVPVQSCASPRPASRVRRLRAQVSDYGLVGPDGMGKRWLADQNDASAERADDDDDDGWGGHEDEDGAGSEDETAAAANKLKSRRAQSMGGNYRAVPIGRYLRVEVRVRSAQVIACKSMVWTGMRGSAPPQKKKKNK
jgi:hypothetical protein